MQIWTKDLFHNIVLYYPISQLITKYFHIGHAIGMNQLVVCTDLTLLQAKIATSTLAVTIPLQHKL